MLQRLSQRGVTDGETSEVETASLNNITNHVLERKTDLVAVICS
jgi:hypothetical protein